MYLSLFLCGSISPTWTWVFPFSYYGNFELLSLQIFSQVFSFSPSWNLKLKCCILCCPKSHLNSLFSYSFFLILFSGSDFHHSLLQISSSASFILPLVLSSIFFFHLLYSLSFFIFFRAIPEAYGNSQAGIKSELQLPACATAMQDLSLSATYTTAHGNTRSLTH